MDLTDDLLAQLRKERDTIDGAISRLERLEHTGHRNREHPAGSTSERSVGEEES